MTALFSESDSPLNGSLIAIGEERFFESEGLKIEEVVVLKKPFAFEGAKDLGSELEDQASDFEIIEGWCRSEVDGRRRWIKGSIKGHEMEMNVQIDRGSKALRKADTTCLRCWVSLFLGLLSEEGHDGAHEDSPDVGASLAVECDEEANGEGKGEHPLSNWGVGEDVIDEMGGGVRHTSRATGRTESASLARERHEQVVATVAAPKAREAMSEDTALEVGPQLALDKLGQTSFSRSLEKKGFKVFCENSVENALFGPSALVGEWCCLARADAA